MNDLIAASGVKAYNSAAAEPFLNGSSTAYVEEMYNAWLRDPASVHAVSQGGVFHVAVDRSASANSAVLLF